MSKFWNSSFFGQTKFFPISGGLAPPPYQPVSHYLADGDLATSLLDRIGTRHFSNFDGLAGPTTYSANAWPNGSPGIVIPFNGTQTTSRVFTGPNTYPFVSGKGAFTIGWVCSRNVSSSNRFFAFGSTGAGNHQINLFVVATATNQAIRACIGGSCPSTVVVANNLAPAIAHPYAYIVMSYDGVNTTRVLYRGYSSVGVQTSENTFVQDVNVLHENPCLIMLGTIQTATATFAGGIFKEAMVYDKALSSADCNTLLDFLFDRWSGIPSVVNPSDPLSFFNHRFVASSDVATSTIDQVPGNDTVSSFHGAGADPTFDPNGWTTGKGTLVLPANKRWRLEGSIGTLANTSLLSTVSKVSQYTPWTIALVVSGTTNGVLTNLIGWFSDTNDSHNYFVRYNNNVIAMLRGPTIGSITNNLASPANISRFIILTTYDGVNHRSIVRHNITSDSFTEVMSTAPIHGAPITANRLSLNGIDRLSPTESPGLSVAGLFVANQAIQSDEMTLVMNELATMFAV